MDAIRGAKNAVLQRRSQKLISSGATVIDLTRGELDRFPPPIFLRSAADALTIRSNGYTDTGGLPELRDYLADLATSKFDLALRRENIMVTAGAKGALHHVMLSILDPGDEVIIPIPYWTTFPEQVRMAGAIPVHVDTSATDYQLKSEAIRTRVTERTKAIVLNSPNNPTGRCIPNKEITSLAALAAEQGIYMVFDECYRDLTYDDLPVPSLGKAIGGSDRFIIVDSFSKSWALTGWRIGYVCAAPEIIKAVHTIQTHASSNPSSIAQHALLRTLAQGGVGDYVADITRELTMRRDWVTGQFSGLDSIKVPAPQGGFFAFVDVGSRRTTLASTNIDQLCEDILMESGVLVVPGTAFGHPGGFRISFGGDNDSVYDGVSRIVRYFASGRGHA